jgi:hypothetical protein
LKEKNMKRIVAIASMAALMAGCATGQFAGNDNQQGGVTNNAAKVERMARLQGCDPLVAANLISKNDQAEQFQVKCSNGRDVVANCDAGSCNLGAGSSSATPVSAQATSTQTAQAQPASSGQTTTRPLQAVISAGITNGGHALASAVNSAYSVSDVKGGNAGQLSVGADYRLNNDFSIQGTVGYQRDNASAPGGSLQFTSHPIEILAYYHLDSAWRIGGGVRFDASPKATVSSSIGIATGEFNTATGAVLDIEYLFGEHFGLNLRAIGEKYTVTGDPNKFNANQVGLFFNAYF